MHLCHGCNCNDDQLQVSKDKEWSLQRYVCKCEADEAKETIL
jgi:hypothetical protein